MLLLRLVCLGRAILCGVPFRQSPNYGAEHDCIQSDVVEGRSRSTAGGHFLGPFGPGRGPIDGSRCQGALLPWGGFRSRCARFGQCCDTSAGPTPPATEGKLDTGDNAWVLTSSALVLMMTGPGLALFYCGLVRKKNVMSVMMQCIFLMCLMSVIWALYGYTIAFGGSDDPKTAPAYMGTMDNLFMRGVEASGCPIANCRTAGSPLSPSFPV